jgi:hypothetical protein
MGFGRGGLPTRDEDESELEIMQEDIQSLREDNHRLADQVEHIRRLLEQKLG